MRSSRERNPSRELSKASAGQCSKRWWRVSKVEERKPATWARLPTSTPTHKVSWESWGRATRSGREDGLRGISYSCLSGILAGDTHAKGGWRSGIPWACLYQLRTRSMAFNLVSGVRPRPPGFFQESSSKAFAGFCGIVSSRERPDCASPLSIVHMFLSKVKRLSRDVVRSYRHLFARPGMKYQFIAEHEGEYPVTLMCQVLGVSVSGYYASRQRPISHHQREDARLSAEIQTIFLENRQVYGSPRIHAA